MYLTFSKDIKKQQVYLLNSIYDVLKKEHVKIAERTNQNNIDFESFGIFSYISFDLFSLIDYGSFAILQTNHKTIIKYRVVSIRIWLFVLIAGVVTFFQMNSFYYSLSVSLIVFGILAFYNYVRQLLFFLSIIKKCKTATD